MKPAPQPITIDDAMTPSPAEAMGDVRLWQEERIAERVRSADAGHFASAEAVRAVVRKYVPNG